MNTTNLDVAHAARLVDENVKLQARIAELEAKVAKQDEHLRQASDEVTRLQAKVRALEFELAPVRALKVGSWQWAMVQHALKYENHDSPVRDRHGHRVNGECINSLGEPYTLHVEPEPEPTAVELAEAIERFRRGPQGLLSIKEFDEMVALADRVKRTEGGE